MRLLLVNKFLRPVGGAETVLFQQWRWLEAAGHEVIPFGLAHPENPPSPYAAFWPPPVAYDRPGPGQIPSMVWSRASAAAMARLVERTAPDVAILHNIYHQLSPSILAPLRRAGIPALMMVHDYKLVCPNYRLYTQGAVCTRCVGGSTWHAVRHRCMRGSAGASLVVALESAVHRRLSAYRWLGRLLVPSRFAAGLLTRGGWPADRVATLPHAMELPPAPPAAAARRGVLFVGRLVPEKGLDLLLAAAERLPDVPFIVVGDGPAAATWRRLAPPNVSFRGALPAAQVAEAYRRAAVVAVPSLWLELFGLCALEAAAHGAPVVAADHGGLPEIVAHKETGLVVPPRDVAALAEALATLLADPSMAERLGEEGRRRVARDHDPGDYTAALLDHARSTPPGR